MVAEEKGLSAAMNAKITGSGDETVVLAHGFGGDQSLWDEITPLLSEHYKVMAFDWSFSGAIKDQKLVYDMVKYSSYDGFVDDLVTLLDENNIKSCVFVGHSMSGMIGCIASVKRPELFSRLILVGASPRYINMDDYEGGFPKSGIDQLVTNVETDYDNWCSNFPRVVVGAQDHSSVDKFQKCLQRMRPDVALHLAKTVFYSDHRDVLEKVTVPCTIINTTNDIVVPNSVAYYMQDKIKGKSTVKIIEGDGHFPHLTAPVKLGAVIGGVLEFKPGECCSVTVSNIACF